MPQINCEINCILTWPANFFILAGTVTNQVPTFAITDTKINQLKIMQNFYND